MACDYTMSNALQAVFRCDASPSIGGGHVSRCLSFAEALDVAGWRVAFAATSETLRMMPTISAGNFTVHEIDGAPQDEPKMLRALFPEGADLLVVDHYQRDIHFEATCRGWAGRIAVLDDATGRQHDCDILIDAAAHDRAVYAGGVPCEARLLLGPAYALVRRAFVARRAESLRRRDGRPMTNVLVSFGATDPWNVTPAVLQALVPMADDVIINVALSSHAPHLNDIHRVICGQMRVVLDAHMPDLMVEADLAIGAAGASAYERAALGLPSIVLLVAENQRGIAEMMERAGAMASLGTPNAGSVRRLCEAVIQFRDDAKARVAMAQAAAAFLDGRASQRLMAELAGKTLAPSGLAVRLRAAEPDDGDWLLNLQQAPGIRQFFENPAIPVSEEHAAWLSRTLANPMQMLLVIEVNSERAGYVRLDRAANGAKTRQVEISIAIAPRFHRRGVGSAALSLTRRMEPNAVIDAKVLPGNLASKLLFERAGYREIAAGRYRSLNRHRVCRLP
jgi:UDP-2,4-diacetamido-2,4,6-trideoxy-beta-L-altropyranose hydrolase